MSSPGQNDRRHAAFFDVDGTLLARRSLTSFLDFVRHDQGWNERAWFRAYHAELGRLARASMPRAILNAFYFTAFRGSLRADVMHWGARWYAEARRDEGFMRSDVVRQLRTHQVRGARVVLVSGSFLPVLQPLLLELACDAVLCTELEVLGEVYSGNLCGSPCLGSEKAQRINTYAEQEECSLAHSHAYGDDESDAAMLEAVGYGHWIAASHSYRAELTQREWGTRAE